MNLLNGGSSERVDALAQKLALRLRPCFLGTAKSSGQTGAFKSRVEEPGMSKRLQGRVETSCQAIEARAMARSRPLQSVNS
jgi:hypothetical protein